MLGLTRGKDEDRILHQRVLRAQKTQIYTYNYLRMYKYVLSDYGFSENKKKL